MIDAHAHIGYYGSFFNVGIEADELVGLMTESGIEKTVICALDNDMVRIAHRLYPDRLIPIVWVNPMDGSEAVEQVRRYVDDGFFGIKIHPLMHSFAADDRAVDPVAEAAAKLGVPLFVHSGHPPFSLPWSIARLARRHPQVSTVMVHMGHGHAVYIQAAIEAASELSNVYLETSGMPMHTKIREAYRMAPRRVMFGTDVPFHHPSVEIQRVRVSGLSQAQLSDVFEGNAARLLGL